MEGLRGLIISGLSFGFCFICGEVFDATDGNPSMTGFGDGCLTSLGRSTVVDGFRGEEAAKPFDDCSKYSLTPLLLLT